MANYSAVCYTMYHMTRKHKKCNNVSCSHPIKKENKKEVEEKVKKRTLRKLVSPFLKNNEKERSNENEY